MILNREKLLRNGDKELIKAKAAVIDAIEHMLLRIDSYYATRAALDEYDFSEYKNLYCACVGKAAVPMAMAVCEKLEPVDGVVATNKRCIEDLCVECIKGSHPVPDRGSLLAGQKLFELLNSLGEGDLVVFCISGGASAIVEKPYVSLDALRKTTQLLLKSDLDIHQINCIRKHISAIKGGKLLKGLSAHVISFIVSDVIDNDLSSIASGLTWYDDTTFEDAMSLIEQRGLKERLPSEVVDLIAQANPDMETLKKDQFDPQRVNNIIISSNKHAVSALRRALSRAGYPSVDTDVSLTCNVHEASLFFRDYLNRKGRFSLVVGGEVTVDVKGDGKGGRNHELALIMSSYLEGKNALFVAFATDGKDGSADAAGAIADPTTVYRARKLGLDPDEFLKRNDSYTFFYTLGDSIVTDDTRTNVTDVYILVKY